MDMGGTDVYETPAVNDYGSLTELTQASIPNGFEDGASKNQEQHHSAPVG